jgi:hypothetical protein
MIKRLWIKWIILPSYKDILADIIRKGTDQGFDYKSDSTYRYVKFVVYKLTKIVEK